MDASTVRAWASEAARALDAARGTIDRLNVFPVPDGDTGTNLALTVAEGADHVRASASDGGTREQSGSWSGPGLAPAAVAGAADVAAAFARGTLRGARGNSGLIVSQYLQGFADGLAGAADAGPAPGAVVAVALESAERAARTAVARPVEGTILTAASAAATAARAAAGTGADEGDVASAAVAGARHALARSRQTLDVLRAAGVVDAGATGLVVLLEALATVLGRPQPPGPLTSDVPAAGAGPGTVHAADDGEFEVMYVVEPHPGVDPAPDLAPELSRRLQALGGSVAVVGGADGWHVHVHTDHPDAAVAVGAVGVRSQVVVRRLMTSGANAPGPGVVVGTTAPALVADLARSGAVVLVLTGRPVTARAVRRAVVDTGARHVAVLPGSPAALAAAREAVADADVRLDVLDAADDVAVVVALAAGVAAGWPDGTDPVAAMRAALATTRTGAVERADLDVVLAEARRLLADGGDVLTVLSGADACAALPVDALRAALTAALTVSHPDVEVVVLAGGQSEPAVALAVE